LCLSTLPHPPGSTPFPYTTLFRSWEEYENVRLQQIERELAAVRELGASEETIALARSSRILELAEEEFRIFSESAERIRDVQIGDRKSTRLNSSHVKTSYAVFCLK